MARSRAALRRSLVACFSVQPRRGLDVSHVAEQLHVTERTVQRWIRGSGREPAPIGIKALARLQFGDPVDQRRELQKLEAAHDALEKLAGGRRRDIQKRWREQNWLQEHRIVTLELHRGLRQVIFTNNNTPRARDRDAARYGSITASVIVPTRFHAIAVIGVLLEDVQAWRLHPSKEVLSLSRSRCWSIAAPAVDLASTTQAFLDSVGEN